MQFVDLHCTVLKGHIAEVERQVCGMWVQATAAQQAEMKKINGLQEKLGAELAVLSQKMSSLQTSNLGDEAQGQVRQLCR